MTQGYSVIWNSLTKGQRKAMDVMFGGKQSITCRQTAEILGVIDVTKI